MLGSIADFTTDVLFTLGSVFKTEAGSYIDIETVEDDMTTFVRQDGTLVTIANIRGVQKLLGPHEFPEYLRALNERLTPILGAEGHSLQLVHKRDPFGAAREIDASLIPARKTAERLNMDIDWVLNAKRDALVQFCASESTWLAISTNYGVFSPIEIKAAAAERVAAMKNIPRGRYSQNMTPSSPGLYSNHVSTVGELIDGLRSLGVVCEAMNAHDALTAIRKEVDPEFTSDNWRPLLPGDRFPVRFPDAPTDGKEMVLYPRLRDQVFPRGAGEIVNHRWIEIGDNLHAPLVMSMPPQSPQSFQGLLGSLIEAQIPFRVSIDLTPKGLDGFNLKSILASILHITSGNNKRFNAAYDGLRQMELDNETIIGFRLCADTWAPAHDPELMRNRASRLSQCIQSWGNSDTRQVFGDPLCGVSATLPGTNRINPAPAVAAPIHEITRMLPMARPASPWTEGALPFRTPDGKLMPYQPGSSLQTAAVTLAFAPMGQGKSVLLNAHNLALALRGGLERLPYISILDIGPSSSGLIALLQHSLPDDMKDKVMYHRLKMTPDYAINPFDLPLGLRKPMPDHKAMLVNLLCILCTEVGEVKPESGVAGIASQIVEIVYDVFAERTPKRFDEHQDPELTQFILSQGLHIDHATTWYEIVDELFEKGYPEHAARAQRYAVPLLGDCAAVVKDPAITNIYKGEVGTKESVIDYVWRMINEAINEFPILAMATRFDISNARVVSLDLDEVCPKGSAKADKQTGVMYMLARYVLAQRYYFGKDSLPFFSEKYRAYHARRVAETASDPKLLCLDEFHRTGRVEGIREQIVRDIREGRKWGIQIMLVSQNIDDFDDIMINLSSTRFVLGANTPTDADDIVKRFELSPSARDIILNKILKPGRKGAGVYCSASTELGNAEMYLYLTLGLTELWAFDSSAENRTLRDILYQRVGARRALEMLCKYFPSGSAVKEIERRRAEMSADRDEQSRTIIEVVADEILLKESDTLL